MEETYTDREFCKHWKIDRATSLRWREQGIVKFIKLPNGQIRYLKSHIDELTARFQQGHNTVKGSVVNIRIAESGRNV